MLARMGHEGGKSLKEDEGLEDDVGRPVSPGMAEFETDAVLLIEGQALACEGWAADVSAQVLETDYRHAKVNMKMPFRLRRTRRV